MTRDADIVTALRRSDRALAEQIAQWEALDFGVAYTCLAFPDLPGANQLRDVWLADVDGESAYRRAEAYFAERGLTCRSWTPASEQAVEPVQALLVGKGWRRIDRLAMGLAKWDLVELTADPLVRVLPARAMPKAYRQTFGEALDRRQSVKSEAGEEADAAFERMNDSNLDVFVAMVDGQPAGRISYLSVGDAARLADVFVLPVFRRRGMGLTLVGHVLQLARRLLPKAVVAAVAADDAAGQAFLKRCGFAKVGMLTEFQRPIKT